MVKSPGPCKQRLGIPYGAFATSSLPVAVPFVWKLADYGREDVCKAKGYSIKLARIAKFRDTYDAFLS